MYGLSGCALLEQDDEDIAAYQVPNMIAKP